MAINYADRYSSTLSSAYTAGGTSLVVNSVSGLPTGATYFFVIVQAEGANTEEVFFVSNVNAGTKTLTVVGAQARTSASNHSLNAAIIGSIMPAQAFLRMGEALFPPASPTTWDDEFDSTALDAKWGTPGSVTDPEGISGAGTSNDVNTTWPSCVQARLASTATTAFIIGQTSVPSATGAFQATIKLHLHGVANFSGAYFYVDDAGASNAVRVGCEFNASATADSTMTANFSTKDAGTWTFNRFLKVHAAIGTIVLQLQRDGSNNWRAWFSLDGRAFVEITSGNYAKTFTAANLYISLKLNGAAIDTHMGCDWIRFNWLTLP